MPFFEQVSQYAQQQYYQPPQQQYVSQQYYLPQQYYQPPPPVIYNPDLYNPGPYYGGGQQAPPPVAPVTPLPPTPAAPAVTAATVSDLQILIASIPIAQDGQVISAEYHNALRVALIAMANRLGLGTISEEITVTNAPQLLAMTGGAAWQHDLGVVRKPTAGTGDTGNLRGWMEFDLPDGARIKRMQVHASTDSANGTMRVRLRRQSISSSAGDDLISIPVEDDDLATLKQGDVTLPDSTLGAAAIEETRFVDNRTHKYLFIAEIDGGLMGRNATVGTIQVVLGK
jgi:hypothetical protein